MILEIQHETHLSYSEPVTESITEVRMEPVNDTDQSCRSFHLAVSPATGVFRYQDGFGNRVHTFNIRAAHGEVRILAASVVEVSPRPHTLADSTAVLPLGRPPSCDCATVSPLTFASASASMRGLKGLTRQASMPA